MVSNLEALLHEPTISASLGAVGSITQEFLASRFSGTPELLCDSWVPTPTRKDAVLLEQDLYDCMARAFASRNQPPPNGRQVPCSRIQHGHLTYQPFSLSAGNSNVLFEYPGSHNRLYAGQIESIYFTPSDTGAATRQITLVARVLKPLNELDLQRDPYHSHPLIGRAGYALARLYYDELDYEHAYILEPKHIIGHMATCRFNDENKVFSAPCVTVLSLDLVCSTSGFTMPSFN
jgi:hypothetical protein